MRHFVVLVHFMSRLMSFAQSTTPGAVLQFLTFIASGPPCRALAQPVSGNPSDLSCVACL